MPGRRPATRVPRFTAHQLAAAEALGEALASSTRVDIFRLLAEGELASGAIARALETRPSHVSNHLKVLFEAHFVSRRREGKFRYYRLTERATVAADGDVVRITLRGEEGCSVEMTVPPPWLRLTGDG